MTPTPPGAPLGELLTAWLPRQRWYAGKGRAPRLERVGTLRLAHGGAVGVETLLLRDGGGPEEVLYQVPITYRPAQVPELRHALVGRATDTARPWVYDGCHDPVGAAALLELLTAEQELPAAEGPGAVRGRRARGSGALTWAPGPTRSRVLAGEQSNTSIIFDADSGPGVVLKVFRILNPGENPDVVLQQALAEAGSTRVPAPLGAVEGDWADGTGGVRRGHLAFAQEFLPGVRDAWRVALGSAAAGADFTPRSRALGEALAEVHRLLAVALPVRDADDVARAELRAAWLRRASEAVATVPQLAEHEATVREVLLAGAHAPWPRLQRIHGDLHLGQVLDAPGRGWVLLDFEGEPLRPLAERNEPDLALRDVAGMLRSFDYAAASAGGANAAGWAERSRRAFLDGYGSAAGRHPAQDAALLRALVLDKALYEAVYEARNRPDWLWIPVQGVLRTLRETV